jgi:hypothetical protein
VWAQIGELNRIGYPLVLVGGEGEVGGYQM